MRQLGIGWYVPNSYLKLDGNAAFGGADASV